MPDKEIHVILDNYSTHKHPRVKRWLKRHPRFHVHFIPTSSSWLNLIERWFREITDKRIRRAVFHSVPDLVAAIMDYIAEDSPAAALDVDEAIEHQADGLVQHPEIGRRGRVRGTRELVVRFIKYVTY